MSKPYTNDDFSDQIAEDRSWRIKEISDLKSAIIKADHRLRRVLLRSLIAICYAHWEGYVRFAGKKYLQHVALRKLSYGELHRQFVRNHFLPRLANLSNSKISIADRCDLVDDILNSSGDRFSKFSDDLLNTKANLNFDVFSDICRVCSVPVDTFAEEAMFIDVFLLKRRNSIAHGEDTYAEINDLDKLADGTISLMRTFGDQLENIVYMEYYRSAARRREQQIG